MQILKAVVALKVTSNCEILISTLVTIDFYH